MRSQGPENGQELRFLEWVDLLRGLDLGGRVSHDGFFSFFIARFAGFTDQGLSDTNATDGIFLNQYCVADATLERREKNRGKSL